MQLLLLYSYRELIRAVLQYAQWHTFKQYEKWNGRNKLRAEKNQYTTSKPTHKIAYNNRYSYSTQHWIYRHAI